MNNTDIAGPFTPLHCLSSDLLRLAYYWDIFTAILLDEINKSAYGRLCRHIAGGNNG